MNTLSFSYSYAENDEEKLKEILGSLEKEIGGVKSPYWGRAGAIDLVDILKIVVVFMSGIALQPVAESYFEGLFNGDKFKQLGEEHREKIANWINNDVKTDIEILIKRIEFLSTLHFTNTYIMGHETEFAVALTFDLGQTPLYVVVNHSNITAELLGNIPDGVVNALQYVIENGVPNNTQALQLYFDKSNNRWKYLLAPTVEGLGRWINQYVDLDTQAIYKLESRREFLELFHPNSKDELKFLVNPFDESRS